MFSVFIAIIVIIFLYNLAKELGQQFRKHFREKREKEKTL